VDSLRAPSLKPGDAVSVVVPAGPPDPVRVSRALGELERLGLRVKTYGDLFAPRGYLAAPDDERLRQLNEAFRDPHTAAVLPARGGYGCARLLEGVDYQALKQRPKVLVGFSDLTALHAAIAARTGVITFHGPNLQDGWGREGGFPTAARQAWERAVFGAQESPQGEIVLDAEHRDRLVTLVPGVAQGRLYGGNLAVWAGLVGSPYLPDLRGNVLLLEDIGEQPYRLDRFFAQLRLAGALDGLAAVLVGQFTDCAAADDAPSLSLEETLRDYLLPLGVPVLAGFPAGHVPDNVTLPLGALVEVDASARRVRWLEPLHAPRGLA
jgi:muramoyltetrapeptide carboxypeptidase